MPIETPTPCCKWAQVPIPEMLRCSCGCFQYVHGMTHPHECLHADEPGVHCGCMGFDGTDVWAETLKASRLLDMMDPCTCDHPPSFHGTRGCLKALVDGPGPHDARVCPCICPGPGTLVP